MTLNLANALSREGHRRQAVIASHARAVALLLSRSAMPVLAVTS
jgi:hypothetical protein